MSNAMGWITGLFGKANVMKTIFGTKTFRRMECKKQPEKRDVTKLKKPKLVIFFP